MNRKTATFRQAARAVFWAFFGVRRGEHYEADVRNLTPGQVIVAGLIGMMLFVGIVAAIVYLVLHL